MLAGLETTASAALSWRSPRVLGYTWRLLSSGTSSVAHAFGQAVNVLEQQKADHEPRLDPGPTLVAVQRRDLAVEKLPVDRARELSQFVLHVDDLVQPRAEQITRSRHLLLLRSHRFLRCVRPCNLELRKMSKKDS